MKKIEDMVKEIEQRCLDIISQDEQVCDEIPDPPKPKVSNLEVNYILINKCLYQELYID